MMSDVIAEMMFIISGMLLGMLAGTVFAKSLLHGLKNVKGVI